MGIFRDLGKGLSRLVIAHDRIKHLPPGNFYAYVLSLKNASKCIMPLAVLELELR